MRVVVLMQPGDSPEQAALFRKDIEDILPGEINVDIANDYEAK